MSGYAPRYVVLNVDERGATLWEPPSQDLWRWVIIGATLAKGDHVLRYDHATSRLDFQTPPPRQLKRAAVLTGERVGPWSWEIDAKAYAVIAELVEPDGL